MILRARFTKLLTALVVVVITLSAEQSFSNETISKGKNMKFGYTILYVKDLEKTISFYERAFGLKRKFVHESGYGELETGDTKLAFANLELAASNGVKFHSLPIDGAAPAFEIALVTEDVEGAFKKAVTEGAIEVKKPTKKPWGQLVGYVRDLNGFLVEICSPMK